MVAAKLIFRQIENPSQLFVEKMSKNQLATYIIPGVVLGVAGFFGYRYFNKKQQKSRIDKLAKKADQTLDQFEKKSNEYISKMKSAGKSLRQKAEREARKTDKIFDEAKDTASHIKGDFH